MTILYAYSRPCSYKIDSRIIYRVLFLGTARDINELVDKTIGSYWGSLLNVDNIESGQWTKGDRLNILKFNRK